MAYNSIPNNAPLAHLRMREHKESDLDLSRIKTALVDADYQEAITYSFVDPKYKLYFIPKLKHLYYQIQFQLKCQQCAFHY